MKRNHEITLLVVFTILLVSSAASLLQASASMHEVRWPYWMRQAWHAWHPGSGSADGSRPIPPPAPPHPASDKQQEPRSMPVAAASPSLAHDGVNVTQDLQTVASDLVHDLSPTDWSTMLRLLTNDDPAAAASHMFRILQKRLPAADITWLEEHATGRVPFDTEDVRLLQQSVQEIIAGLTPTEKRMLLNTP
ncbi:MAG: hypothetical protein K6T83_09060 [Alicyclobacillus sp.]|nr:hypothetical protein [Alicyclobacillus sp.]